MNKIILSLLFAFSAIVGQAQFEVVFSSDTIPSSAGTVDIDVSVNGFTDVISASFSVNWDATVLSFASIENISTELPELGADDFGLPTDPQTVIDDGNIIFSWFQNSTAPASVPDGTRLFTIRMNVVGDDQSGTQLTISNSPRVSEVYDQDFEEVPITTSGGTILICDDPTNCANNGGGGNGGGGGGNGGGGNGGGGSSDGLTLTLGNVSASQGATVCIPITASNFNNIESFSTGILWDPAVLRFTEVRNGGLTVIPNSNDASSGMINILWLFDQAAVSLPDGTVLFEVCFEVIGSTGQSTNVSLGNTPTIDFEIGGADGAIDDVTINNTTFTVGSGNGVGNEDGVGLILPTLFTEGASNICIPVTAANFEMVAAIQTAFNYDTTQLSFTGINPGALSDISVNGGFAGSRPLRILWTAPFSTPSITVPDGTVLFELCFDVIGSDQQSAPIGFVSLPDYRIEVSNEDGVAVDFFVRDGNITVGTDMGGGNNGGLQFTVGSASVDRGQSTCLPVTVENFTNIEGMGYSMGWDQSVARFLEVRNFNLPQLGANSFNFTTSDNLLNLSWTSTSAVSVADGTVIYELCLQAVDPCGPSTSTAVAIMDGRTAAEIVGPNSTPVTDVQYNPGTLEVTNCTVDPGNFMVRVVNQVNPTCGNSSNGAITVEFEGATGAVTCLWRDNATGLGITAACDYLNAPAGNYTLTATDQTGRQATVSVTLSAPPPIELNATVSNASCNVGGLVRLNPTGGTLPYTYQWSGSLPAGTEVSDLDPGTYAVTVTDANGCSVSESYVIENVSFVLSPVVINNTSETMPNGSISLNPSPNNELTYSWSTGATTPIIEGLSGGTYTVIVTDVANDCTKEFSYTVEDDIVGGALSFGNIIAEAVERYNGVGVSCNGDADGALVGTITGGCGMGDNVVTLNGEARTLPIENLAAGEYTLKVVDGCGAELEETFTLSEPDAIILDGTRRVLCPGDNQSGIIELNISGGTGAYELMPSIGNVGTGTQITGLGTEAFTVVVMDDNGCQMMFTDLVLDTNGCGAVDPPGPCPGQTIISPNADGVNDTFTIGCSSTTPNRLSIYDRWGKLVMQSSDYDNSWSGTDLDGNELPEGGYMWVMETGGPGNRDLFRGTVSILR